MPTSGIALSLNSAMSWGRVTASQVTEAVGDPAELAAETRLELKSMLEANPDKFEPAAQIALRAALAAPERTSDPSLMKHFMFKRVDLTGVSYQQVPGGELYRDGLSPNDVEQGQLGDCYLLSALAGFAQTSPKVLTDAITDNQNGTYTVRFFRDDPAFGPQAEYVTVDADFPTKNGWQRVYAQTPNGELWPAVIEKAFAKFQGGYGRIGQGGLPGDVAYALTGDVASMRFVVATSAGSTFERITKALAKQHSVTAGTMADALRPANNKLEGLVAGHAYSVERTFEENGTRYVELRNPWGYQPPIHTTHGVEYSTNNGVFRLTADDFKAGFPFAFIAD